MAVPHFVIIKKEDCPKKKPDRLEHVHLAIKDAKGNVSRIRNDALPVSSIKTAGQLKEVLFRYIQAFNTNAERMTNEQKKNIEEMDTYILDDKTDSEPILKTFDYLDFNKNTYEYDYHTKDCSEEKRAIIKEVMADLKIFQERLQKETIQTLRSKKSVA